MADTERSRLRNHARRRAPIPLPVQAFGGAALVAMADQATKEIIRSSLAHGERIPVTGFFNVVFYLNPGAAFGMLASSGWQAQALLAIGVLAIIVLSVMLFRTRSDRSMAAGLSAILGGATGNVMDRLRHGAVVDWLDLHVSGWHWPAFNLADSALTFGAATLILAEMRRGSSPAKRAAKTGSP